MIAIITAMQEEMDAFISKLSSVREENKLFIKTIEGILNNQKVVVALSGVGKSNASVTTALLVEYYNPEIIINIGSAGGLTLHENSQIGDLVIGESLVYHDVNVTAFGYELGQLPGSPARFFSNREWIEKAKQASKKLDISTEVGLILSGDNFITNNDSLREVKSNYPDALAIEMEGAAIAHICWRAKIPFLVIRSISDFPLKGNNSVDFKKYIEVAASNSAKLLEIMINNMEEKK